MSARVIAYVDGGARGNPGPAGYGVLVETTDGLVVDELKGAIGIATNNTAEYHGLIAALEYCAAHGHSDVVVRSDSRLLTRQMTGEYRVRHPALKALHAEARELASRIERVHYEHVPRAQNTHADALANAAMDGATVETESKASAPPPHVVRTPDITTPAAARRSPVPGDAIIGIGIDIEEVARVDGLVRRYGDRFLERVFTEGEAAYSRRRRFPGQHLTARFSAKEATMKALGTGHSRGVSWRDVEVVRQGGPPQLELHGGARRRFEALGATGALLTITHSRDLAMAQVVLLGR